MTSLKDAIQRVRRRSELEKELRQAFEGKEFYLPVFETEEEQILRQRPDYEELLFDLHGSPQPVDLNLGHEKISYRFTEVELTERSGVQYKLKRLAGRTNFEGWLKLELDFGEEKLPALDFSKHPLYEDLNARIRYYNHHTEMTIHHEFEDKEVLGEMLFTFNRILATCWSVPDTIPELRENVQKWEVYKQFKEQTR